MKTCPFCAEEIKTEAIKCKHCGSSLNVGASSAGRFALASAVTMGFTIAACLVLWASIPDYLVEKDGSDLRSVVLILAVGVTASSILAVGSGVVRALKP